MGCEGVYSLDVCLWGQAVVGAPFLLAATLPRDDADSGSSGQRSIHHHVLYRQTSHSTQVLSRAEEISPILKPINPFFILQLCQNIRASPPLVRYLQFAILQEPHTLLSPPSGDVFPRLPGLPTTSLPSLLVLLQD